MSKEPEELQCECGSCRKRASRKLKAVTAGPAEPGVMEARRPEWEATFEMIRTASVNVGGDE